MKIVHSKKYYQRFLKAQPDRLHFAAHSHHYWPDITREAHIQAWDDAARWTDKKWDKIFSEILPEAQGHFSRVLGTTHPERIAIAPNTHELALRLLSCLPSTPKPRILTTDGEFHSWARQLRRLEESGSVEVRRVPVEPMATFMERFVDAALQEPRPNMAYVSHVFFNSGHSLSSLEQLCTRIPESTRIVVDGYHAFHAIPVDLRAVQDRIYYLGGGYKYAQSGEGICFMHLARESSPLRPQNTGWLASLSSLQSTQGEQISYDPQALSFLGSTLEPSGLYRWNAVARLFRDESITVADIHEYVLALQKHFLEGLSEGKALGSGAFSQLWNREIHQETLLNKNAESSHQAHFLCFETTHAAAIIQGLSERNILCDARSSRVRIGFGLYQDGDDLELLFDRLRQS